MAGRDRKIGLWRSATVLVVLVVGGLLLVARNLPKDNLGLDVEPPKNPWAGPGEGQVDPPGTTFGFFLVIFNSVAPVLRVLRSVRQFYPDSPIHLLSDGGSVDFSELCRLPKYNCTCQMLPGENIRYNPHPWLLRFHHVAQVLGTDYVIYLEPDVKVQSRHHYHPPYDAGGIYDNFNRALNDATFAYMQARGRQANPCFKLRWGHYGLAGGSYFRTSAVLDAFAPANVARIDFKELYRLEGVRAVASDFAMHVALSMRGYIVYPWRESGQYWKKLEDRTPAEKASYAARFPAYNLKAAFQHDHKEDYHDSVPQEEHALLRFLPPKLEPDPICLGCVWYTGPDLEQRLPIARPATKEVQNPQPSQRQEDLLTFSGLGGELRHPEGPEASDFCRNGQEQDPSASPSPSDRTD